MKATGSAAKELKEQEAEEACARHLEDVEPTPEPDESHIIRGDD